MGRTVRAKVLIGGASMTARQYKNKADRLITPGETDAQIACDFTCPPLDRLAMAMDRKWGVDCLVGLVAPATAQKYGRAMAFLNSAMAAENPDDTRAAVENCIKGLNAMDAEATASGKPRADPAIWEYQHEGHTFAIIADGREWPAAYAARPGLTIYSMHEVAVALHAWKNSIATVAAVKMAFPGAAITAVRQRSKTEIELEDEIPY